jgi:hypothetical protein
VWELEVGGLTRPRWKARGISISGGVRATRERETSRTIEFSMWRHSDNASASGNLVVGTGEHWTAANEYDVEAADLREWTSVSYRNICIVD